MSYLSLSFTLFVACLIPLFYIVPTRFRGLVLLCGSLVFYGSYDLKYYLFFLFVAGSSFLASKMIRQKRGKAVFVLTILLNVAVWFAIKVLPWTMSMFNRVLQIVGLPVVELQWNLLVPLGISYYTLQAIGYLVDVYRGNIEPEKSFWKYILFLSWFPAIVQGPISRYDKLMPQHLHKISFPSKECGSFCCRLYLVLSRKWLLQIG